MCTLVIKQWEYANRLPETTSLPYYYCHIFYSRDICKQACLTLPHYFFFIKPLRFQHHLLCASWLGNISLTQHSIRHNSSLCTYCKAVSATSKIQLLLSWRFIVMVKLYPVWTQKNNTHEEIVFWKVWNKKKHVYEWEEKV